MTTSRLPADDLNHILAHTHDDWNELRGRRIFITGGTGFFGMWLLESFAWANHHLNLQAEAHILTRDRARFAAKAPHLAAEPSLHFLEGDVQNFDFPAGDFSFVIHAATPVDVAMNRDQPLEMLDTIIRGTRRVLDFAVSHGTKKFLLTSSGAVYGRQPPEMTHVPEEYPGAPRTTDTTSAYGEGKRLAELLCAIYARQHSFEIKIARCFSFVGPHLPLDGDFAVGNFIRDAISGGPIRVEGDGTPRRSYLYAADLAIWLWKILFSGTSLQPYNVGSDDHLCIRDLAERVREACGHQSPVLVAGEAASSCLPQRYVPLIAKAQRDLGLMVLVGLADSLRRTLAFLQKSVPKGPV